MKTFKYGTRVVHAIYGYGKALNTFRGDLVQVDFDKDTGMEKRLGRSVTADTLEIVGTPKFETRIQFLTGAVVLSGPLTREETRQYLAQFLNWDEIDSIDTKRLKSSTEQVYRYFEGS